MNNLVVEKCWDVNMRDDFLIEIAGEYYLISWHCGKINPEKKRKVTSQEWASQRAKRATEIQEYMYPLMGLEKRNGYNLQIGRAITEQEFAGLKEELNLSEEQISEPFEDVAGKYMARNGQRSLLLFR